MKRVEQLLGAGFLLDDWQRRVVVELVARRPAPRRRSWGELYAGAVTLVCCLALLAMGAFLFAQWWELL